ncbi:hypothetical protein G6F68_017842 [Rhizopus microsporus]|nr:hypothetical protein G6F68_017842 [Rhizopus microsporus]
MEPACLPWRCHCRAGQPGGGRRDPPAAGPVAAGPGNGRRFPHRHRRAPADHAGAAAEDRSGYAEQPAPSRRRRWRGL